MLPLQSLAKLLSHLEGNDIFVLPSPHVNVVLKKGPDRDDTRNSANFCITATLNSGEGEKGKESENLGVAQQFCSECSIVIPSTGVMLLFSFTNLPDFDARSKTPS